MSSYFGDVEDERLRSGVGTKSYQDYVGINKHMSNLNAQTLLVSPLGGTFDGAGSAMVPLSGRCLRLTLRGHLTFCDSDFAIFLVPTSATQHY